MCVCVCVCVCCYINIFKIYSEYLQLYVFCWHMHIVRIMCVLCISVVVCCNCVHIGMCGSVNCGIVSQLIQFYKVLAPDMM